MPLRLSFSAALTALLTFFSLLGAAQSCLGVENPAVKYCLALGYQYIGTADSSGNAQGYCRLPDNSLVEAWAFFQGMSGQQYSYCAGKGLRIETRTRAHPQGFTTRRAVCIADENLPGMKAGTELDLLELLQGQGKGFIQLSPRQAPLNAVSPKSEQFNEIPARMLIETFDWRDQDQHSYIGPVRDQGACGDCYAFGAAAAAETAYNIRHHRYDENTVDFSESFIAWCLGAYGPYSEHFSGCNGADYEYAELDALTREGVTLELNFPYTEEDPGSCTHNNDPVHIFSGWGRIPPNDTAGIKKAIMKYGALDAAIFAPADFIFYSGGLYSDGQTECPDGAWTETNHAVALVGWGKDAVTGEYWILRNSWGVGWGENGYMKIAMKAARVACATAFLQYTPPAYFPPIPALYLLRKK